MIRINVVCIGKVKEKYIREGIAEFSKRLSKYTKFEIIDYRLCFSKMTFPHQLMRLILSEQIYRWISINNNIKYHK